MAKEVVTARLNWVEFITAPLIMPCSGQESASRQIQLASNRFEVGSTPYKIKPVLPKAACMGSRKSPQRVRL